MVISEKVPKKAACDGGRTQLESSRMSILIYFIRTSVTKEQWKLQNHLRALICERDEVIQLEFEWQYAGRITGLLNYF